MKIKIDDIPEDGLSLDVSAGGKDFEELAKGLDFTFSTPVEAHVDVNGTHGRVFVQGDLRARVGFVCSRCLKPFDKDIESRFSIYFVRGTVAEREKELTTDDLEINYIDGPELDVNELLIGQIALEAPVKPLCSEGCPGLCAKCGKDLSAGACDCKPEDKAGSSFGKLKEFKLK
ncbi:DUF177 domain-containing protein [bacterium]|nr:MAG: DUF177 domain-containing protein [bacterium]